MSDLIDRQAAIDAPEKLIKDCNPDHFVGHQKFIEFMDNAEIGSFGKWQFANGFNMGLTAAEVTIKNLPSAQPECQWIPCSERLPEHGGRYLISVLDGINRRITVAPYLPRCKAWTMTGRMAYWKVIAWMPLPEPAKLGGD